jgi:hypothetical protein
MPRAKHVHAGLVRFHAKANDMHAEWSVSNCVRLEAEAADVPETS